MSKIRSDSIVVENDFCFYRVSNVVCDQLTTSYKNMEPFVIAKRVTGPKNEEFNCWNKTSLHTMVRK